MIFSVVMLLVDSLLLKLSMCVQMSSEFSWSCLQHELLNVAETPTSSDREGWLIKREVKLVFSQMLHMSMQDSDTCSYYIV